MLGNFLRKDLNTEIFTSLLSCVRVLVLSLFINYVMLCRVSFISVHCCSL